MVQVKLIINFAPVTQYLNFIFIQRSLVSVTDWVGGDGTNLAASMANTVTRGSFYHVRTCPYSRVGTQTRRKLCLPLIKCIYIVISKTTILQLEVGCLLASSGIHQMEAIKWLITVNLLFMDWVSLLHRVCMSSIIMTNISCIRWRLQVRNLRLSIADAAPVTQLNIYDHEESLRVLLMTISVICSGSIVSITSTF